jgi:hypothetical protein
VSRVRRKAPYSAAFAWTAGLLGSFTVREWCVMPVT